MLDRNDILDPSSFPASVPLGEEGYPCVVVATAVLRRAFQDLTIKGEPGWPRLRREAYAFLTEELWEEDCLWRQILADLLPKHVVLRAVHAVVMRTPEGRIITKKGQ